MMVKISEVDTVEQYAVDFGRTADRIQMNPTKSTTLLGLGGEQEQRQVCTTCRKAVTTWNT